jgi:hypothetical protein
MDHGHRRWAVGALLYGCMEFWILVGKLCPLPHAYHAVMLSIFATTRGQVRLTLRG